MATKENVTIRQFTIGRYPQPAAPRPMPVSTASEIGVKRTRSGPNSVRGSPAKSVAMRMTRGSRRISSATASSSAFWKLISRITALLAASLGEHVDEQVLGIGKWARLGKGHRLVEIGLHALAQRAD